MSLAIACCLAFASILGATTLCACQGDDNALSLPVDASADKAVGDARATSDSASQDGSSDRAIAEGGTDLDATDDSEAAQSGAGD